MILSTFLGGFRIQDEENLLNLLESPNFLQKRESSYNEDEEMLKRAIEESLRK